MKSYLGSDRRLPDGCDAVYVDLDDFGLVLTTEDGYSTTNRIVLEPGAWEALKNYVDRLRRDDFGGHDMTENS